MKKSLIIVCLSFIFYNISAQGVKIGDQIWSTKNLNVNKYKNGAIIPEAKSDYEWEVFNKKYQGAWCYYNYDPKTGIKFYNFYAVNDKRGICPSGWHVPSFEEWQTLENFLRDTSGIGNWSRENGERIAKKIIFESAWGPFDSIPFHTNQISFNETGFSAIPSGGKNAFLGWEIPKNAFSRATWWSSTLFEGNKACVATISGWSHLLPDFRVPKGYGKSWAEGHSVRCIKD